MKFRSPTATTALLLLLGSCGPQPDNAQVASNKATPAAPPEMASNASGRCPAPLTWGAMLANQPQSIEPVHNTVSMDRAGDYYWNGQAIDGRTLRQYLDLTTTMRPRPLLRLEPDPSTPCDKINQAIALIGGVFDCTRECAYAQVPFDPHRFPPPSRVDGSYVVAMHFSNATSDRTTPACQTTHQNVALNDPNIWSPWVEVPEGCSAAILVGPDEHTPNAGSEPFIKQCQWHGAITENCDLSEAVRFRLRSRMVETEERWS